MRAVTAYDPRLANAGATAAGVTFSMTARSAGDSSVRGGDVFEVLVRSDGSASVLIADASSKGTLGALHAEMIRGAFLHAAGQRRHPAHILAELGEVRLDAPERSIGTPFASAFVGTIERGTATLRYACAGHAPALIVRAGSVIVDYHRLRPTGPLLGIIDDAEYVERGTAFGAGDLLVLATDGFTECRSSVAPTVQFGEEGILAALAPFGARTSTWAAVARVGRRADQFTGGRYRDDATLAVVARRPG